MSTSTELALEQAHLDIVELRGEILDLRKRGARRDRALLALALVVVVLLGVAGVYFYQRKDARSYYNGQLHNLACLAVKRAPSSVSPTIRDLREQYHCPPYQAPTPQPSPSKKHNPRALPPAPTSSALSAPSRTVTVRPSATPSRTAGHRPARATPSPRPTGTPTGPTRTPSPSPTSTGLLGPILCNPLLAPILCRTEHP